MEKNNISFHWLLFRMLFYITTTINLESNSLKGCHNENFKQQLIRIVFSVCDKEAVYRSTFLFWNFHIQIKLFISELTVIFKLIPIHCCILSNWSWILKAKMSCDLTKIFLFFLLSISKRNLKKIFWNFFCIFFCF